VMRSAEVFEDAVAMAGLQVADLDVVLLVGGASRTPLVARTILGRFGLEASTDAHPKSAVCLGAAITAGAALAAMPVTPAPTVRREPEPVRPEPARSEPVRPEPARPAPVRSEPVRPAQREYVQPEPWWPEPAREPVREPEPVAQAPAPPAPPSTHWAPSVELTDSGPVTEEIPRIGQDTLEIPVVREPDYVVVDLVAAGLSAVDEVPTRPAVPLPQRLRSHAADQATVDLSDPGYHDQARRSAIVVVALVSSLLAAIAVLGLLTR